MDDIVKRASQYAALGDPVRLMIVEFVRDSDRTVNEIREYIEVSSSLLAHHLDSLEAAGLIVRHASSGDARRRYVSLAPIAFPLAGRPAISGNVLFVCTENSARSQLASAVWSQVTNNQASSAGTRPARSVHPRAIEVARRYGLDIRRATPRALTSRDLRGSFVVTVCDNAYEELGCDVVDSHWSIPDPAANGTIGAFVDAIEDISRRINNTTGAST